MGFKSFMDSKVKKMDWLDVGMVKWSCIAFGVLLVMLFPALLDINIYYVLALAVVLAIRPAYRVYFKK